MTKKNLTLGLLVFIVGVALTACGSKSNTSNTSNPPAEEVPKDFENGANCGSDQSCVQSSNGTLRILDKGLYLEAFGHRAGNDITFNGDNVFNNILQEVAFAILEPAAGVAVCAGRIYLTEAIAELAGIDNVDIECTTEDLNLFDGVGSGGGFDQNIADNYPARLRIQYVNGRAEAVELTIDSNINGGDDQEVFRYDRPNVYVNDENSLLIQNDNGRIRFGTTNGRLIGEFLN